MRRSRVANLRPRPSVRDPGDGFLRRRGPYRRVASSGGQLRALLKAALSVDIMVIIRGDIPANDDNEDASRFGRQTARSVCIGGR